MNVYPKNELSNSIILQRGKSGLVVHPPKDQMV